MNCDDTLVVFPTRWLVRQYRDECLQSYAKGTISINAITFDDMVDGCIAGLKGLTYIDDVQRRIVLEVIMRKYSSDISYFKQLLPGYIWTVAQDIGELKMAGISPAEFQSLWLQTHRQPWAEDLYILYRYYQSVLERHGLYDKEDRYAMAAKALQQGRPSMLAGIKRIEFRYFFDLTPLQQDVIEKVGRYAELTVDKGVVDKDVYARHVSTLGDKGIIVVAAWDRRVEMLWVAQRIKRLLEKGYDPSDICIVARDTDAYKEPLRYAFKKEGLPLTASDTVLSDNGIVSGVLGWLDSLCGTDTDIPKEIFNPSLKPLLSSNAVFPPESSLSDYARRFLNLLQQFNLPMHIIDDAKGDDAKRMAADLGAYAGFMDVLRYMETSGVLVDALQPICLNEFVSMLQDICQRKVYNWTMAKKGITFLTPSQVRGLKFGVIFAVGMVEGEFPRAIRPDWLIKDEHRLKAGGKMMSSNSLLALEKVFFHHVVCAAERYLHLTYPRMAADGAPMLPSSFIEDMRTIVPNLTVLNIGIKDVMGYAVQKGAFEAATASEEGCAWYEEQQQYIKQRFSKAKLSVTAFNEYGACPYKFFLGRVLGLEPMDDEEGTFALDVGSLYHAVLKDFMQLYIGQTFSLNNIDAYKKQLVDIALRRLEQSNLREHYPSPELYEVEKQRMVQILLGWLDAEMALQQRHKGIYKPYRLEWIFGVGDVPSLTLDDGIYSLHLEGRVDRIDLSKDGRFIVYDYKKGKSMSKIEEISEGTDFQLPVYILAAGRLLFHNGCEPAGAAYYSIEGKGIGEMLVKKDSGINSARKTKGVLDSQQWAHLLAEVQNMLMDYYKSILGGRFPRQPKKCPLRDEYNGGFCRFTDICADMKIGE